MKNLAPTPDKEVSIPPTDALSKESFTSLTPVLLGRRGLERLDLLLLVIESLDLNGAEAMLWTSERIGLQRQLPNRVELWKLRCHNPLRKATRRGKPSSSDSQALIRLLCSMADRLYPLLHQLLSSKEPVGTTLERWTLFTTRLEDLIQERMNTRRAAVQNLLNPEKSQQIIRHLVFTLALASGLGGEERLTASLLDLA